MNPLYCIKYYSTQREDHYWLISTPRRRDKYYYSILYRPFKDTKDLVSFLNSRHSFEKVMDGLLFLKENFFEKSSKFWKEHSENFEISYPYNEFYESNSNYKKIAEEINFEIVDLINNKTVLNFTLKDLYYEIFSLEKLDICLAKKNNIDYNSEFERNTFKTAIYETHNYMDSEKKERLVVNLYDKICNLSNMSKFYKTDQIDTAKKFDQKQHHYLRL